MPVGFQIAPDLDLKGFSFLSRHGESLLLVKLQPLPVTSLFLILNTRVVMNCSALWIQHPVMRKHLPGLVVDD
ncbi:hypothetical protein V6N11_012532 [Hibiscus sabdariffa]|uniref:Uncharacterized protein n=2 Tax=Hibiscus sabdariffa TaxID=183260 RepID=A0ABR2QBF8_9ROSI